MLKQSLSLAATLAIGALPLAAQQAPAAAPEQTITGQVVDINCYTVNGAQGAGHKDCATACANKGVALAILASDGTLYIPVSGGMGDPQNPKLLPHVEGKVRVTGMTRTKGGLHTIEIKSIAAATT
ncbi:MAG TPA: hypothetical protein VGA20_10360 [Gemmatimonadales bacterium]